MQRELKMLLQSSQDKSWKKNMKETTGGLKRKAKLSTAAHKNDKKMYATFLKYLKISIEKDIINIP